MSVGRRRQLSAYAIFREREVLAASTRHTPPASSQMAERRWLARPSITSLAYGGCEQRIPAASSARRGCERTPNGGCRTVSLREIPHIGPSLICCGCLRTILPWATHAVLVSKGVTLITIVLDRHTLLPAKVKKRGLYLGRPAAAFSGFIMAFLFSFPPFFRCLFSYLDRFFVLFYESVFSFSFILSFSFFPPRFSSCLA